MSKRLPELLATRLGKVGGKLTKALLGPWPPVVHAIRLDGPIGTRGTFSNALNLEGLADVITAAFEQAEPKAVALLINSPGGSPAQSMLIHARIRALAAEKKIPVYAFAEDVAASGGYMLACAADEIYATESSILGSIGVVAATFGFEKLIERVGVERRLYTAGTRKSLLDPFLPVNDEDVERLKLVQQGIHESFKSLVRTARGARLTGAESELFSGEFWTGVRAQSLGLIDGIGDVRSVMRAKFGDEVRVRVIEPQRRFSLRNLASGRSAAPGHAADQLLEQMLGLLEARALWGRFGL